MLILNNDSTCRCRALKIPFKIYSLRPQMKIAALIFELLQTHDCVIMPGLGGFLAQNKSASLQDNNLLLPPARILSFNARLNGNDGLLVHSLANNSGIAFAEAQQQVEKFVQTAIALLQQNEAVHFDKVGSLNFDTEGNLQFVQHQEQELFAAFFGLKSITALPVEREKIETPIITVEPKKVGKVVSFKKARQRKRFNTFVKYAAAAVVVLALTISGIIGFLDNSNTNVEHTASLVPAMDSSHDDLNQDSGSVASAEVTEMLPTIQEPAETIAAPVDEVAANNEVDEANETQELKHGYYVIVGAFSKQENAHALYTQLQHELGSATPVIKFDRNGLTAVGFYSAENATDAAHVLARAKQKDSAVWLLKM